MFLADSQWDERDNGAYGALVWLEGDVGTQWGTTGAECTCWLS